MAGAIAAARLPASSPVSIYRTEVRIMRLDTTQQMRTEMALHGALHDPVYGNLATADHGAAGTDRAGAGRESDAGGPEGFGGTETDEEQAAAPAAAEAAPESEPDEFDSLIPLDENWSEIYDEGPEAQPGLAQRRIQSQTGSDAEHGVASPVVP